MTKPANFSQLVEGDYQLKRLVKQLDQLNHLLHIVQSALSPELARVCQGTAKRIVAHRFWNINQIGIDYSLRPHLSTRLTLGGRALPRNPWN
jgi:hypothetical protein